MITFCRKDELTIVYTMRSKYDLIINFNLNLNSQ